MNKIKISDWAIRAGKTFAQAFFGVLIPELVSMLGSGFPDLTAVQIIMAPALSAALAAGISAVWNICLEKKNSGSNQIKGQ